MKEEIFGYLSSGMGVLTLNEIILNFIVAVILSCVIYIAYKITHSGALYSSRFNVSISMLTLITTLVMEVIGNNIALSLGMVGALSIVRFRTAIKDSRDTAFIFWGIAVGICCGVSEYVIACVGTVVIFVFLMVFGNVKNNDRYLLVIVGKSECREKVDNLIEEEFKNKARLCVRNTSRDSVEIIYELTKKMIDKYNTGNNDIVSNLYKIDDVEQVNIIAQSEDVSR